MFKILCSRCDTDWELDGIGYKMGRISVGLKWSKIGEKPKRGWVHLNTEPVRRESDKKWYKAPISKRQRRTLVQISD